jgi:hypothetical protein
MSRYEKLGMLSPLVLASLLAGAPTASLAGPCACCAHSEIHDRVSRVMNDLERVAIAKVRFVEGFLREDAGEGDPALLAEWLEVEIAIEGPGPAPGDSIAESAASPDAFFTYGGEIELFATYPGGPRPDEPDVELYKEIVLEGVLTLGPALSARIGQTVVPATLVLKGTGNRCFSIRDYRHWLLQFSIPTGMRQVRFAAAGTLPARP